VNGSIVFLEATDGVATPADLGDEPRAHAGSGTLE
jgi:hypothetical protein